MLNYLTFLGDEVSKRCSYFESLLFVFNGMRLDDVTQRLRYGIGTLSKSNKYHLSPECTNYLFIRHIPKNTHKFYQCQMNAY